MNAISRRVYFRGFTFSEFINRYPEALDYFSANIKEGKIKVFDHVF
jgi:NADPH-dependent curcumin reductase CurA